ncbi:MAG TPA: hypothetical protein VJ064_04020, partial [Limnochordia bacterium]|nr:hypothetical protein [Limnochordia bacterium]
IKDNVASVIFFRDSLFHFCAFHIYGPASSHNTALGCPSLRSARDIFSFLLHIIKWFLQENAKN